MRLIDADALKQDLLKRSFWPVIVKTAVEKAPTIDSEPVKHGRWVLGHVPPGLCTPGGNRPWICSECGTVKSWRMDKPESNYCPNCGAKMDLEET